MEYSTIYIENATKPGIMTRRKPNHTILKDKEVFNF